MMLASWLGCLLIATPLIASEPTAPPDGSYQLHITHRARLENNENPLKPLPSARYIPVSGVADIRVRIFGNGREVLLLPNKISGSRVDSTNSIATYQLEKGLFAGGSLSLEKADSGWIGTFTEFGSGRPIISSVRGTLTAGSEATSDAGEARMPAPR